jgi:hypothetical protein
MCLARSVVLPLLAALALSACATSSTSGMRKSSTTATVASADLPDSFAGAWFVTAVFPTGATHGNAGDRHIGTAVLVKGDDVSDVNGHRCSTPAFVTSHVTAEIAGMKMTAPSDIDRVQVNCADKPFAILLQIPGRSLPDGARGSTMLDGSTPVLIVQRAEALYLLERAEEVLFRQASVIPALTLGGGAITGQSAKPAAHIKAQPATVATSRKPATTQLAQISKVSTSKTSDNKAPDSKPPAKKTMVKSVVTSAPKVQTKSPTSTLAQSTTKPQPLSPTKSMTALMASDVAGAKPAKPAKQPASNIEKSAAKPTVAAPKPGAAIHLASYAGISAAVHGWETLRGQYPELTPLKPVYVSTDVSGKAPLVRLFAAGAAPDKLRQICSDLQSKQAYCTLNP